MILWWGVLLLGVMEVCLYINFGVVLIWLSWLIFGVLLMVLCCLLKLVYGIDIFFLVYIFIVKVCKVG